MGLPVWRDPEVDRKRKDVLKRDPSSASRSSIRRRPSVHGRRVFQLPPRIASISSRSANTGREPTSRRSTHRGVPPVSILLESTAAQSSTSPDAGQPSRLARGWYTPDRMNALQSDLRSSIQTLQERASQLGARAAGIQADLQQSVTPDNGQYIQETVRSSMDRTLEAPSAYERLERRSLMRGEILATARRATQRTRLAQEPNTNTRHSALSATPRNDRRPRGRSSDPTMHRHLDIVNGLGDRNRSPTGTDGWEAIRTTLTADSILPSADSSFTSAAASNSFALSNSTTLTEPDADSLAEGGQQDEGADDSVSSVATEDLFCDEHDDLVTEGTGAFAKDMYYHEMETLDGRTRIAFHQGRLDVEGRNFALAEEPDCIEIGFRLINSALDSDQGRARVYQVAHSRLSPGVPGGSAAGEDASTNTAPAPDEDIGPQRHYRSGSGTTRSVEAEALRRHSDRRSDATRAAPQHTSDQGHSYYRRVQVDTLISGSDSPPPQYEPPTLVADMNMGSSVDRPQPRPLSPPSARSERETADALLSGDDQELDTMRRIVERLAARDDVPDEWWMAMGLNLARTNRPSRD